jgi:serine/threonine-protein kinase
VTTTDTGRYTRRRRIATGGMGEVWLAHDEVLHRDVAVKYLKHEYADDQGFHTRFLHEARNAAGLHHPGIATVFDFGEGGGVPFLVMEYVEGRPLSELLAGGMPLDPDRARDLVTQTADALAAAHATGLVHRDVKPGNLMVRPDGTVKVTDFGIARAGDGMALTETGQLIGTPSYLSPEQAEGGSATPASDVYSLGVVLFECLTGRRPYDADSPIAIALAHVREPVPELPVTVPGDLAAVTRRALAKDPADRYPDAGALAAALRSLGPLPAQEPVQESAQELTLPLGVPGGTRVAGGRALRTAGLAAVAVLAGALLVAVLTSGDETNDTPPPGSTPSASNVSPTTPATVSVDPAAYVGRPVAEVRAALGALGLDTRVVTVDNPGGKAAGTVAALRPTGAVAAGAAVRLDVWGPAPKPGGDNQDRGDKPGKGKGKGKN